MAIPSKSFKVAELGSPWLGLKASKIAHFLYTYFSLLLCARHAWYSRERDLCSHLKESSATRL